MLQREQDFKSLGESKQVGGRNRHSDVYINNLAFPCNFMVTPEQLENITTLLDGIDFENGEIHAAQTRIKDNLQEIRDILSGNDEVTEF